MTDKPTIEAAFSRFDDDFHDLKSVISAIEWIAGDESPSQHDHGHAEQMFSLIAGLGRAADRMMERRLYRAGCEMRAAASDSVEPAARANSKSRRFHADEDSSRESA
jgi:hypothetical protein